MPRSSPDGQPRAAGEYRPLYPATNQAARAMRKAHYARKHVACEPARPTEHPSAPAIQVQKDQVSDSMSNAATSDTPRKRDWPTQPDRTTLRAIDSLHGPVHQRARECGQILRTLLFIKNDSASSSRPNAMLSRRRTIAAVNADW